MQEFADILHNPHLNRFAGLFAIAMSPGWRMRHPEVASVRGRLDQIARIVRGGGQFDTQRLLADWTKLLVDIRSADSSLYYTSDDMDWLIQVLSADYRQAGMTIMMLLAVASSNPRWYTCEQLGQMTNRKAITWKKRAALPDNPWMVRTLGNTHLFNELVLRAHGVDVPRSMQVEIEEESSESE
jgi:hypothetical protein